MAETEAPFWNVPFLLAVRITVVKKVWVWLGEGRTLQNTQMFLGRGQVVGRWKRDGEWTVVWQWGWGDGEEKRQSVAWTGPGRKTCLTEVRFAHRCPTSALGNLDHVMHGKHFTPDRLPKHGPQCCLSYNLG